MIFKPIIKGLAGTAALLGIYFSVLSLVSGWTFAQSQFSDFWYFIIPLAIGFGVQVGLYSYLKGIIHRGENEGRVLAVSGTTSTAAMISCCAHYLANILPFLAVSGAITFVTQYQIEFFWVGLLFNLAGIIYISEKVIRYKVNENK